jgi:anti-anti-sigma regulatory factor
LAREVDVLKIIINETPTETRWILHGRLIGDWVDELRMSWKKKPRRQNAAPCVIDLNDVSFIDEKGERLLRAMAKKGARFIATGIYIKYVLQEKCAR